MMTPATQRKASSHFRGVQWDKTKNRWKTVCKRTFLGYHTSEEDAARAYNLVAARVGLNLNVIPPAGAAGLKRAAPKTAANQKYRKVKLDDASLGGAGTAGSAGAGGVMRVTPAQWAKLEARVYAFQNRGKGYS